MCVVDFIHMKRVPGAIVKVARVMNRRVELQTEVDISAKTAAAPPRPSGSLAVWSSPSVFNFRLKIIFSPLPALIIYFSVSARLEINEWRSGVESEVMEQRWIGVFVSTGSRPLLTATVESHLCRLQLFLATGHSHFPPPLLSH